jgi:hypothetical protein
MTFCVRTCVSIGSCFSRASRCFTQYRESFRERVIKSWVRSPADMKRCLRGFLTVVYAVFFCCLLLTLVCSAYRSVWYVVRLHRFMLFMLFMQ